MIIKLATAIRNAMAQLIKDAIDAGGGAGTMGFYSGTVFSDNTATITDQVLLGTVTFSDPCGTISGGVLTFAAVTQDSAADASGTATCCVLRDSTGAVVAVGDVTNNAGTGFVKLNTTTIAAGGPIQVSSGALTMPGG